MSKVGENAGVLATWRSIKSKLSEIHPTILDKKNPFFWGEAAIAHPQDHLDPWKFVIPKKTAGYSWCIHSAPNW